MQISLKIAIAALANFVVVGCQLVTDEEKVLTILYWQAPSIPSAYQSGGIKDVDAAAIALEPLAKYAPDGSIVPALAEGIPTIANGGVAADLTSVKWKLKKGIKWSDGSEMTTDDVEFTWAYCFHPDTGCTGESSFDGISSVEAIDNQTVKIFFDAPTAYPYNAFVGTGTPIIRKKTVCELRGWSRQHMRREQLADRNGSLPNRKFHPKRTGSIRTESFLSG